MTAASRGSSSFHGMAKQSSYAVRVWRFHALRLEGILELDVTASKFSDISIEVRRSIGPQLAQSSGEPAFEAGSDCCELAFDGGFGQLVCGDPKLLCDPLEVSERFLVLEVEGEGGSAHGMSLHPCTAGPPRFSGQLRSGRIHGPRSLLHQVEQRNVRQPGRLRHSDLAGQVVRA